VLNPRILVNNRRVPSLPCYLADALRVRCAALDETLRQRGGPDLMFALLRDIDRLSEELRMALETREMLERIRRQSARPPTTPGHGPSD